MRADMAFQHAVDTGHDMLTPRSCVFLRKPLLTSVGVDKVCDLSSVLIEVLVIHLLLCRFNSNDAALDQPLGLEVTLKVDGQHV